MNSLLQAKANIFEYIYNKNGIKLWSLYWNSYKQFLLGNLSKNEFDNILNEIFDNKTSKNLFLS